MAEGDFAARETIMGHRPKPFPSKNRAVQHNQQNLIFKIQNIRQILYLQSPLRIIDIASRNLLSIELSQVEI